MKTGILKQELGAHGNIYPETQGAAPRGSIVDDFYARTEQAFVRVEAGGLPVIQEVTRGGETDVLIRELLGRAAVGVIKEQRTNGDIGVTHFELGDNSEVCRVTLHDTTHYLARKK